MSLKIVPEDLKSTATDVGMFALDSSTSNFAKHNAIKQTEKHTAWKSENTVKTNSYVHAQAI